MRTLRKHSRHYSYVVVSICLGCLTFLSACGGSGGGSGADSFGTGTVSFSLALHDRGTIQASSFLAAVNSESQFECQTDEYLIAKIEAGVYDENDELLAEGGPWDCEDHQGTIHGVDAGAGRIVKVSAKDESENNIFWGKSEPVTVIIGQDSNAGQILLETVNRSPELSPIGNREINEGELLEFEISATDPDGDRLLFEIGNKPSDAEFAFEALEDGTAIATFSWRPAFDSESNYKVVFKVTDSGKPPLSDFEEITISVGNVPLPPVLNPIGNREVDEGEKLEFDINATDPDSINLRFEMGNKPADASFTFEDFGNGTGTATFNWTPGFGASGEYPVIFKVFDDSPPPGGPLSDFEEIKIVVGNVCRAPELDPIIPPDKNEDELIEFKVTAKDPDLPDDVLSFSCVSDDSIGIVDADLCRFFDPFTQTFSWTPGYEDQGEHTVRFIVTDACKDPEPQQDFEDVTIHVGDTCRSPILDPIKSQNVNEDEELRFTLTATDPDLPNDSLSFSCVSDDSIGIVNADLCRFFDPSSRTFRWTPGYEDQGEYTVRFIVTDACENPEPQQDFEDVTITVDNTCRPPILGSIGSKNVNENEELRFTLTARDEDLPNDSLSFSCVSDSSISIVNADLCRFFDPSTRTFRWTPGYEDQGEYTVRFIVTDACENPEPLYDFEDVKIIVYAAGPY